MSDSELVRIGGFWANCKETLVSHSLRLRQSLSKSPNIIRIANNTVR